MEDNTLYQCETCQATFQSKVIALQHVEQCFRVVHVPTKPADLPGESAALPSCSTTPAPTATGIKDDDKFIWTNAATKSLLALYSQHEEEMCDSITRKSIVWGRICEGLNAQGYGLRVTQVEGKWKTLVKAYRKTVDHNSKSGNDRKSCPFFEELDELLGMKPNITPVATTSLGVVQVAPTTDETPKKKEGKRKSTSVLEWLKDWSEKKAKVDSEHRAAMEARFLAQQQMFERKMTFMENFLKQFNKES